MKQVLFFLLVLGMLTVPAYAAAVPQELERAIPEGAEDILELEDTSDASGLENGVLGILHHMKEQVGEIVHQRVGGAIRILLVVLLCGMVEGGTVGGGGKTTLFLPMAGALAVTALAAGSLDSLLGLGRETIHQLASFSQVLLPILAAATAAAGGVSSATMQQITTVCFVEILIQLIESLLMPLLFLYIGLLTAGACLGDSRLNALADGVKKIVTWTLCATMFLFTGYLSAVRILTGTADSAAVKLTKATISGVVPVVGGIISEATETVLVGAGIMRNSIGVFGMLAVLAACAYPFLQLGVQYLLYKLTAFLSSLIGVPELCKLINGLGGAFGLVLGMTGSCALLLLISILSSVAAVIP